MGHIIWTMDEVVKALPARDTFWLSDCACRGKKNVKCEKGTRVCLGFSEEATSTPNNRGPIRREEMEDLLKFAKVENLVPRPYLNDQGGVTAVCFCCPCCCDYILGKPGSDNVAGPSIEATDSATCVSCGLCVPLCYFGARKLDAGGVLRVDRSKCFGCGVCVDACAPGAIKMVNR